MRKIHATLLAVNLLLILGFGGVFVARANHEFVIYVGVIVFFLCVIGATARRIEYSDAALVGLTVWSGLHLAGGAIVVGEGRLYDVIVVPLSPTWPILRYDQIVHVWGFGAATLTMDSLLRGSLARPVAHPIALGIVVVMAGLGVGAFNEIVEFMVSLGVPESGVGGYQNTALDLCADLIGAVLALLFCSGGRGKDVL